jgi:hypothetical protein
MTARQAPERSNTVSDKDGAANALVSAGTDTGAADAI